MTVIQSFFNNPKYISIHKHLYNYKMNNNYIFYVIYYFLFILCTGLSTSAIASSSWIDTPVSKTYETRSTEFNFDIKFVSEVHEDSTSTNYDSDFGGTYSWYPVNNEDKIKTVIKSTKSVGIKSITFTAKTKFIKWPFYTQNFTVNRDSDVHINYIKAEKLPPSTEVIFEFTIVDKLNRTHTKQVSVKSFVPLQVVNLLYPTLFKTYQANRGKHWGENRRECALELQTYDSPRNSFMHAKRAIRVYLELISVQAHSSGGNNIPKEPFPSSTNLYYVGDNYPNTKFIQSLESWNGCWTDQWAKHYFRLKIETIRPRGGWQAIGGGLNQGFLHNQETLHDEVMFHFDGTKSTHTIRYGSN